MQSTLTLGDTLNYTTSVPDYLPSAGWTLKYRLVPRVTGSAILLTGAQDSVDPSLHRVQASATTTAAWVAGIYSWASYVEKAAESYSITTGVATLLPNPRTITAPFDTRTDAAIALDQARAALKAWTPTTKIYEIAGRRMEFNGVAEILQVVSFWENQVKAEENVANMAAGLKSNRKLYVRLGRA